MIYAKDVGQGRYCLIIMFFAKRVFFWFAYCFALIEGVPSSLSRGQFYPTKDVSDPVKSEILQCGSIRDVIRRNTIRYKKVLVNNTNFMIDFGFNGDNRYMTSRAKSKLDVLASKVQSKWGSEIKLRVEKAWTDVVDKDDMLSLHYEGRTLKVKLSGGSNVNTESNLGQLCGLALVSGFDWVYHESSSYIRISVIPDVCQTEIDLAFVIDGSGSVGSVDFAKVKTFLGDILKFYNVGFDQTRIALISYSSSPTVQFLLNRYGSKPEIKSAIDNVPFEGGSTATGSALRKMKDVVFSVANGMRDDKSTPKVGILITDGYSDDADEVIAVSDEVKAAGISMFVIGIGSSLNGAELAAVASDPDSDYLFYHGFEDLSGFVDQMSTTSCNEGAQISQHDRAKTQVDGGSFKYFKSTFEPATTQLTVEVEDIAGKSYLYISTSNKNPGPLDSTGTLKSTGDGSLRAVSVNISSSSKLLYISVQGQEDQNTFLLSIWDSLFEHEKYQKTIIENGPADQIVAIVKSDKSGTFEYKIKAGNSAGHFAIDSVTGEVRTTRKLDREVIANYTLVIIAQDVNVANHRGRTELFVDVGDVNDNDPIFDQKLYEFSVNESELIAYQIGIVSATDRDSGTNGELRYSIISGIGKGNFSLDPNTGGVSVASILDYKIRTSYSLKIRVEDGGNPQKSNITDLIINIVDVNEAPMFTGNCSSGCRLSIDEGNTTGLELLQLSAIDPDTSPCQLTFSSTSSDRSYFSIHQTSGMITTKSAIDRETKEVYELRVVVEDCASPPLTDSVTVLVTANDINDNAPRFPVSKYTVRVNETHGSGIRDTRAQATDFDRRNNSVTSYSENGGNGTILEGAVVGVEVLQVSASDSDIGSNAEIVYSLGAGNTGGVFGIDSTTGVLSLKKQLDHETLSRYELEVIAHDNGKPSQYNSTRVSVIVIDINDNKPEFDKSTLICQIYENKPMGSSVCIVVTSDKDDGINGQITYSLELNETFKIDPISGEVKILKVLDREERAQYKLSVGATDGGTVPLSSTAELTINVLDVDDNCPVFHPKVYNVTIEENLARDTIVVNVTASDRDVGKNAELQYAIKSGDDQGGFTIDPVTGSIKVFGVVDREYSDKYLLKVRAGKVDCGIKQSNYTNIGERSRDQSKYDYSLAEVHIHVTDKNDNAPIFSQDVFYYDFEDTMAKELLNVTATDPDLGNGGIVKFRLLSWERAVKNGEEQREVRIEAHDEGTPIMSSTATVLIKNKVSCHKMSFQLTDDGKLSTTTLCYFKTSPNGSYERIAGESFSLDCRAEGNDIISYRWTKDRDTIAVLKNNGALVIDKVSRKHGGAYECLARNGAGTSKAATKATLVVKERPYIFEHPVNTTVEVGGMVVLSCQATGDPAPRYQWKKYDDIYRAGTGYDTNKLVLKDAILNDAGIYHCEAINSLGAAESKKVTLNVVERGSIVLLTVVISNPKKDGSCHFFLPKKFENVLDNITKKKVSITKFDHKKFCSMTKCEPSPCRNGGKCEIMTNSYHCSCKGGWKGKHCLEDIDECKSIKGICKVGMCQNVKGSYWCKCPAGRTGRNCQYEESICKTDPCHVGELCLPIVNTTSANHTCVAESEMFTTIIKVKRENDWRNFTKFDIETDLSSALQNWKPVNNQSVSTGINFTSCITRVTSIDTIDDLNNDLFDVEHFILCPGNGSKHILSHSEELCNVLLNSVDDAKECKIKNGTAVTPKPVSTVPTVEIDIEAVVTETDGSRTLSAAEALKLINPEIVNDHLKSDKFNVRNIATAFPDESDRNDGASGSSTAVVTVIIAVVAILTVAAIVAFVIKRRRIRKRKIAGAKLTDRDVVILEGLNKL